MICRSLRACFWIALLLPSVAWGGTIYVNNIVGDDRMDGLAPDIRTPTSGPVATIRRALAIARVGDSISVAATDIAYSESVVFDRPHLAGSATFPIVIDGHGATLRGTRRLQPDVWRRVGEGTYRYQPYRKAHYQLIVNGTPAREVTTDSARATPPKLQPLEWCAFRGHVYFRVEPNRYIDQYEIEAPLCEIGLGFHHARYITVKNFNVEFYRLDGVNVSGNSRGVRLENIRSTGNGRAGLVVTGTAQVQTGRLDLAGNRVAERLVLLHGRVTDLPESEVAPPAAPMGAEPITPESR